MSTSLVITRRLHHALKIAAPTALALFGAAAVAQEPSASLTMAGTMKVSLVDLDLSTTGGVSAAQERVRKAARRICAKVAIGADMSTSLRYITCIDEAMANSLAQIAEIARHSSAERLAQAK